jgi:hypothetical protein
VFGEMLEEFCDGKDGGVVLFDGAAFFDAEDAGIVGLVGRVGAEVTFGDEFLPPADTAVAVYASTVEESVFFDVVPAYFV